MNIHEYQAKELLRRYGVAVLEGHVAWTPEEAEAAAAKLPGPVYVVKSQIHAGGRGAGRFADDPNGKGGVRVVKSADEVRAAAEAMIGHTLVTKQTGAGGQGRSTASMSRTAATSSASCISALLVDRDSSAASPSWPPPKAAWRSRRSPSTHPEKILKVAIDPASGISGFHARKLAFGLGPGRQAGRRLHQVRHRAVPAPSPDSTARSSRSTRWSSPARATSWRWTPR